MKTRSHPNSPLCGFVEASHLVLISCEWCNLKSTLYMQKSNEKVGEINSKIDKITRNRGRDFVRPFRLDSNPGYNRLIEHCRVSDFSYNWKRASC